jgi:hypothetical protein
MRIYVRFVRTCAHTCLNPCYTPCFCSDAYVRVHAHTCALTPSSRLHTVVFPNVNVVRVQWYICTCTHACSPPPLHCDADTVPACPHTHTHVHAFTASIVSPLSHIYMHTHICTFGYMCAHVYIEILIPFQSPGTSSIIFRCYPGVCIYMVITSLRSRSPVIAVFKLCAS